MATHYFCLENSMDRGAWWVAIHEVAKSQDSTEYTHTQHNSEITGNPCGKQ